MKISAIVSTYNSECFLASRLDNLLNQTVAEWLEIIVVNSGSEEREREIVRRYQADHKDRIIYVETERENLYQSWNRAIRLCRGQYITNANTDDRLCFDALELLSNALDRDAGIGLVYGDSYSTATVSDIIEFNGTFERRDGWTHVTQPDYSHKNLLLSCLCGPHPMWRRAFHDSHGLFDTQYVVAGDYEFWLRIAEDTKFLHLDQSLGLVYENPNGIENRNRRLLFDENKQLRLLYFGKARDTEASRK